MKLTICENIRIYRKKNDLTQEAFATQLGVTYQSFSLWENGDSKPDISKLPALALPFYVSVDELLGESRSLFSEGRVSIIEKL